MEIEKILQESHVTHNFLMASSKYPVARVYILHSPECIRYIPGKVKRGR